MPRQASIIIPTYNRRELLCLTLESLARQDVDKSSFEVIVVDDGSTDGSDEAVRAFQGRLDVCCIRQEHRGFRVARARNIGIEWSSAQILVFVDSGMVLATGFVSSHLAAHLGDAPVAVLGYVHGYDFNIGSPALAQLRPLVAADTDGAIAAVARTRVGIDIREQVYRVINDRVETLPAPWTLFWTTNVSLPRQGLLDVGGFDEDFVQWGMEDIELGFRLWHKGVRFALSRQAAGIHYPHERDNAANLRSHKENRLLFLSKHPGLNSEALLASDPLRLNLELMQYRAHEPMRADLWQKRMSALAPVQPALTHLGQVVFGFRDGDLLRLCNSEAGIDADPSCITVARYQCPHMDTRMHFGIRTSFTEGQFASCLLAGAVLGVPRPWLVAIAAEAARVARTSYAMFFDGVPCDLPVQERILTLGAGVSLWRLPGRPQGGA